MHELLIRFGLRTLDILCSIQSTRSIRLNHNCLHEYWLKFTEVATGFGVSGDHHGWRQLYHKHGTEIVVTNGSESKEIRPGVEERLQDIETFVAELGLAPIQRDRNEFLGSRCLADSENLANKWMLL